MVILPNVVTILLFMPFKYTFSVSYTNVSPCNLFTFIKFISLPVSKSNSICPKLALGD